MILLLVGFLFSNSQKNNQPQNTSVLYVTPSSGSTNSATSQDPQDVVPGLYRNQVQNTATKEGFTIVTTTVENNTDEAGKTAGDHLELTLKNIAGKSLTDFEVYYTITDPTTNKKEGYYKKLIGFVLKNGETQHVNFDNKPAVGHFTANKNSIYYTSNNELLFDVMVSTPGYKVQTAQVTKAASGAETQD